MDTKTRSGNEEQKFGEGRCDAIKATKKKCHASGRKSKAKAGKEVRKCKKECSCVMERKLSSSKVNDQLSSIEKSIQQLSDRPVVLIARVSQGEAVRKQYELILTNIDQFLKEAVRKNTFFSSGCPKCGCCSNGRCD